VIKIIQKPVFSQSISGRNSKGTQVNVQILQDDVICKTETTEGASADKPDERKATDGELKKLTDCFELTERWKVKARDIVFWILDGQLEVFDIFIGKPFNANPGPNAWMAGPEYGSMREFLTNILRLSPEEQGAELVKLPIRVSEMERFEKEHPELFEGGEEHENRVFPCNPGTKWEDIVITLVSEEMVRVKTPQGESLFTYHQLGMADRRKGDQPTTVWALLKIFAQSGGSISRSEGVEYLSRLPDTTKRLNKRLQELFGVHESIFKGHYKKEKAYKARITFRDHREVNER
jgi:hypothetical protein